MFHEMPVTCLSTHPSDNLVITGSADNSAIVSSSANGRVLTRLTGHKDGIEGVGFCKTMKLAATASLDSTMKVWDLGTGQVRLTCEHDDGVIALQWHPSLPYVFTSSMDKCLR